MEAKDPTTAVARQLARLTDLERLVITLRYVESLNLSETGAVLGLPANAVSRLERRALLRLRAVLTAPSSGSTKPAAEGPAVESGERGLGGE